MKKMKRGVTKRTRDGKVKSFGLVSRGLWKEFCEFVDSNCKGKSEEEKEKFSDALSEIVDGYVDINCKIYGWCRRNGVPISDFICDVDNYDSVEFKGHGCCSEAHSCARESVWEGA